VSARPSIDDVRRKYDIDFESYGILMYHPVVTELERIPRHVDAIVRAVGALDGWSFVGIYPNNDAGSDLILRALQGLEGPRFRLIPSLRFEYFLSLLKHARAIVGNSSAGIREAPVYGVPTVNLGSRQRNRFVYPSIVNVEEDPDEIVRALEKLPTAVPPSTHFGEGNSAALFMACLRGDAMWAIPQQKLFRDAVGLAPR